MELIFNETITREDQNHCLMIRNVFVGYIPETKQFLIVRQDRTSDIELAFEHQTTQGETKSLALAQKWLWKTPWPDNVKGELELL